MPDAGVRLSLHLGVNRPNPQHYGSTPQLTGAERDAWHWYQFALSRGYTADLWRGPKATAAAVYAWMDYAVLLQPDAVIITWAGHGTQVPSLERKSDSETNNLDQTWALYDRMLIDDEICALLSSFARETRVVVVSDSCHSGDVLEEKLVSADLTSRTLRIRALDDVVAQIIFDQHSELYRDALRSISPVKTPDAVVAGLSACGSQELAFERGGRGCFSRAMLDELTGGFEGTYLDLLAVVGSQMPWGQTPRPFFYGGDDSPLRAPAFA